MILLDGGAADLEAVAANPYKRPKVQNSCSYGIEDRPTDEETQSLIGSEMLTAKSSDSNFS